MTTSGISQTGTQPNLVNPQMNELKQQTQLKPEKNDAVKDTDTVIITANIADKPVVEYDAISEDVAINLAALVAEDLSNQSSGISTPAIREALSNII